jgi:hypothetical protein
MGGWWRWTLGLIVGLSLLLALVFPLSTSAQEEKRTETLSWADAPLAARHRSEADWLVDAGWKTSADVFGPFPTRTYEPGDAERFVPLGSLSGTREPFVLAYRSEHAYFWFERGAPPSFLSATSGP